MRRPALYANSGARDMGRVFQRKIFGKAAKKLWVKAEKKPSENYSFQTFVQSFADDYFSAIIGRSPSFHSF